eukprot:6621163-Lingulodinium_polyedra.AAC.1
MRTPHPRRRRGTREVVRRCGPEAPGGAGCLRARRPAASPGQGLKGSCPSRRQPGRAARTRPPRGRPD